MEDEKDILEQIDQEGQVEGKRDLTPAEAKEALEELRRHKEMLRAKRTLH